MNVYHNSSIISQLKKHKKNGLPLKLAFLDLDGTMTGDSEIQQKVKTLLMKKGFLIIFVSSRPYELMLSNTALKLSPSLKRPLSKGAQDNQGKRYHKDLAELDDFAALIDPEVMAETTGINILVKQLSGEYLFDPEYKKASTPPEEWRLKVMDIIHSLDIDKTKYQFLPIESKDNYEKGLTDISPLDYRIQIDFRNVKDKIMFTKALELVKRKTHFNELEYLDESNPLDGKYSVYLLPFGGHRIKQIAVDHIFNNIKEILKADKNAFEVIIAGNGFPDLPVACFAAEGARVTSFFVGGSCSLTPFITDSEKNNYAGENISYIKQKLKKIENGKYMLNKRTILFGDILFPNTEAVTSIYSFLQNYETKNS